MIDWSVIATVAALVTAVCALIVATVSIAIWRRTSSEVSGLRATVAQLHAAQPQFLTGRDLGPIHEKINNVAQNTSGIQAQMKATNEQLRTITSHIMSS